MLNLKALNKNELLTGLVFGLVFALKIGWFALLLAPVTALLWALGGAPKEAGGDRRYRRIGVPALASVAVAIFHQNIFAFLSMPMGYGVLSIGYGIPTTQPPDEGSWLGKLCFVYAAHDEKRAELYCRGILYALLALAFIPCWIAR